MVLSSHAQSFDYIIIGGGSAGCVLANRLSADPNTQVLLLESGGSNRHPLIDVPAGFMKTINDSRFNYCYHTAAGPGVNNREILFPRGKVLGGSSAINGHLYVRGQARDYDRWADLGNKGWGYADVLPYFKRSEDRATGQDAWRGAGGELHVSDIHERHPLCEAWLSGIDELGLPRNDDYNGERQEGFGFYQRTIKNGRRWHAEKAFLRPVAGRANLLIKTHAVVRRLLIKDRRVSGVEYTKGGQTHTVQANRETLLCAGSIHSPQLLQVSGVGPGALLQELGIAVQHDLPGVGEGFQDHYAVRVSSQVERMRTLNERARAPRLYWEFAKWLVSGKGLLAFSPAHVAGFCAPTMALRNRICRLCLHQPATTRAR